MSTMHRLFLFTALAYGFETTAGQEPKTAPPKFDPAALFKRADANGDRKLLIPAQIAQP